MRALLVLAIVGCSGDKVRTEPCERGAKLELRVVDHDSPYMKKLFAHVGSDNKGKPTDPTAIDAGVAADVDQWSTDLETPDGIPIERRTATDYYLRAGNRAALETYLAAYSDKPPTDREVVVEHTRPEGGPDEWRTYYVQKQPLLDTQSVADVGAGKSEYSDRPLVFITLTPGGRSVFARGTKALVGKKLATLVDGEVLSAPIINSEIPGGRFTIWVTDQPQADALLAKLRCVKK